MSKHTPGPWESSGNMVFVPMQAYEDVFDMMPIASVASDVDTSIISAAPEMYEALELLMTA